MSCPEPSLLQAHVEGFATADERDSLRQHLEGCVACRELVLVLSLIAGRFAASALNRSVSGEELFAPNDHERCNRGRVRRLGADATLVPSAPHSAEQSPSQLARLAMSSRVSLGIP